MKWLLPTSAPATSIQPRTVLLLNAKHDDEQMAEDRRRYLREAKKRSRQRIGRRGW